MSRLERSPLGEWWWSIDRSTLYALCALSLSGLVFLMAGSPSVAARLGYSTFHFISRQIIFMIPAFTTMLLVSFLSLRMVRRVALIVYIISFLLILATFKFGPLIKGAHRWIIIGGISIQPSEFMKPAFVILAAWAFAEGSRRKDMPGALIALVLLPLSIIPLVLQPDFGQTILLTVVWCCLFFLAGLHWIWVAGLGGAGFVGIVAAYNFLPHVQMRINNFMGKSVDDLFQVKTSLAAFAQGEWFGVGLGEGTVKRYLPDSHTDYIFAVIGEEFGVVVCLGVLAIFAFVVLRGLILARLSANTFCRLAITGLVTMFGLQATINMMVSVNMVPPKGMTLPFVSYGGSSLLSLALAMGFLLALTRKRLQVDMY